MRKENLQRAMGAIHLRFGGQALVHANRLPATRAWPTGRPVVDRLSGIGGLPLGRISVLQGSPGSGKLSLALALLARATLDFALAVALDFRGGLDPWTLDRFGADLGALTLVRPPTPAAAGEAAVALARAGAGFLLVLGSLPESALAPLESAAARSGCLVVALAQPGTVWTGGEAVRALAYASSLTLELERLGWRWERGQVVGTRTRMRCAKNKLAAPGPEVELEVRYAMAGQVTGEVREAGEAGEVHLGAPAETVGEPWRERSAAG